MAISSINIQTASAHCFAHNDRSDKVTYLIDDSKENECDRSAADAKKQLEEYITDAEKNYRERVGRKMKSDTIKAVEAVVNLNAGHTLKDVQALAERIEKRFGFRAVQIAIHRDEGKSAKDKNYHAHIVMCNLRPDGSTIQRTLGRDGLQKLQDLTAETLMMKRGQKGSKAVRLEHREYKAKVQEIEHLREANEELRYNFRAAQQRISALEASAEEKKELHRLNTQVNKAEDKTELLQKLEAAISTLETDKIEDRSPTKEEINAHGKTLETLAGYSGAQIIASSMVEEKGVFSSKKVLDEKQLEKNIDQVLQEHNAAHQKSFSLISTLYYAKETIIDGAKQLLKRTEMALKAILFQKEGPSMVEHKKGLKR